MSTDEFTKLFKYMQQLEVKIDSGNANLKTDINRVYDLVDKQVKLNETDQIERLAMNHQLHRHEGWIDKASGELKVAYDPAA